MLKLTLNKLDLKYAETNRKEKSQLIKRTVILTTPVPVNKRRVRKLRVNVQSGGSCQIRDKAWNVTPPGPATQQNVKYSRNMDLWD